MDDDAEHEHSQFYSSRRDTDREQRTQYRALMSGFLYAT